MNLSSFMGAGWAHGPQVLCDEEGILLCRTSRERIDGERQVVLAVVPAAEHPSPQSLDRLAHEFALKDELDGAWAAKPLELLRDHGRTILVLEDRGGEPLSWLTGAPMETGSFLRLAIQITAALGKVHQRGLVHKDIKPANILVSRGKDSVHLTGFGFATRRPRERLSPAAYEQIAGTFAYMSPEQTGRMNRSIDSRSDLYSLGVTLYQMITGSLPFAADDPMEWVHCHVAREPDAPTRRSGNVPAAVSGLILKLLSKMAEERYQTAGGAERDLQRCLAEPPAAPTLRIIIASPTVAPSSDGVSRRISTRSHSSRPLPRDVHAQARDERRSRQPDAPPRYRIPHGPSTAKASSTFPSLAARS
jgi:serine/threonine protein kinase